MSVEEVSAWICRGNRLLLSLAVVVLSACTSSSNPASTEEAAFAATLPRQTSKADMDNSSSSCQIRNEIPVEAVTTLSLPEIDVQALQEQYPNPPKDAPLRFARSIEVHIDPANHGSWQPAGDALQVWRLKVISPQALSLSLGFTSFNMPAGGCLFVYSPDHNQVLGPYTREDNAEHGQLWTPTVDGEEVIIEISVPKDEVSRMQLVLGVVNQGYKK